MRVVRVVVLLLSLGLMLGFVAWRQRQAAPVVTAAVPVGSPTAVSSPEAFTFLSTGSKHGRVYSGSDFGTPYPQYRADQGLLDPP